ncbi:MAG: hypothetical protein KGL16_11505 [Acidobacteriota bacterium]|nr:hypothetical protein [Acidobacteriota bacterium]
MPLMTGTVYLFGQILSWALPISLLIAFAVFFTKQARRMPPNPEPPSPPPAADNAGQQAPVPPPGGPYTGA